MKFWWICSSLLLLAVSAHGQDAVKRDDHQMHKLHRDPKAYIGALEDPKRDAYQKPHEVVHALGLKPGEVIADIGAGSGYFTFHLARHVGEKGKVYAVDISPDMILHINRRIRDTKATNVVSVLADPADPLLPDQSVESLFYLRRMAPRGEPDEVSFAHEENAQAWRRIIMIDFHKKELPFGPPLQMKIAREDLIKQMETNGFRLTKEHTFLPHQYFLVFAPR